LRSTLAALESASNRLEAALDENSPTLKGLIDEGTETVATLNARLPQITEALDRSMRNFDETMMSASVSLERIEQAADPNSPPRRQLSQTMQELSLAARALRSLARTLEEHPESLLRGRQDDES
jgi:paraquat-inducible protein B